MARLLGAAILLALLQGVPPASASVRMTAIASDLPSPPPDSWALGVVVPQGASLPDGGKVSWGSASNLSALFTLPDVNRADNTLLVVLSAMIGDGSVLQVSAGLFPRTDAWIAVGWFIPDVGASRRDYEWTLNSSELQMPGGATVLLSLYRSAGTWRYVVTDVDANRSVSGPYPNAADVPFKAGDQEAFALESYTSNVATLREMGNLTMTSLMLDGRPVVSGTYLLGNWDPTHDPLFVVGGSVSPPHLSVLDLHNGTLVWNYPGTWKAAPIQWSGMFYTTAFVVIVMVATLIAYAAISNRSRRSPAV